MSESTTGQAVPAAAESVPAPQPPVLAAEGIVKDFGPVRVLSDVSLEVNPGDTVVIMGRSGSGKTTLLRCLNLLEAPTRGRLRYAGSVVGDWTGDRSSRTPSRRDEAQHRLRVGMVFQRFELFPHLRIIDNVAFGPRRVLGLSKEESYNRARRMLAHVSLGGKERSFPHQLSGGQQQRVAIARSLAMAPAVLLFDEPTSALDPELVGEVLGVMRTLAADGMTMVIVTHEIRVARAIASKLVVIDSGVIAEQGEAAAVIADPQSQATRSLFRSLLEDFGEE